MGHRNVILTGFMGTGKSTIGRLLAERLGYDWVDTDELIVDRHGPVAGIFAEDGEAAFRDYERSVAKELAGRRGLVVSTGGRLMLDPVNIATLGATGPVFCLTADIDTIVARATADQTERPLLAGPDPAARVASLLGERHEGYARFEEVSTEDRTPEEIVADLVDRLGRRRERPASPL